MPYSDTERIMELTNKSTNLRMLSRALRFVKADGVCVNLRDTTYTMDAGLGEKHRIDVALSYVHDKSLGHINIRHKHDPKMPVLKMQTNCMIALRDYARHVNLDSVTTWWDAIPGEITPSMNAVWATVANLQYMVNTVLWVGEIARPDWSFDDPNSFTRGYDNIVTQRERVWPLLERRLGSVSRGLFMPYNVVAEALQMLFINTDILDNECLSAQTASDYIINAFASANGWEDEYLFGHEAVHAEHCMKIIELIMGATDIKFYSSTINSGLELKANHHHILAIIQCIMNVRTSLVDNSNMLLDNRLLDQDVKNAISECIYKNGAEVETYNNGDKLVATVAMGDPEAGIAMAISWLMDWIPNHVSIDEMKEYVEAGASEYNARDGAFWSKAMTFRILENPRLRHPYTGLLQFGKTHLTPINRGYSMHVLDSLTRLSKPLDEQYCFPGLYKGLLDEAQVAAAIGTLYVDPSERKMWYKTQQSIAFTYIIGKAEPLVLAEPGVSALSAAMTGQMRYQECNLAAIVFNINDERINFRTRRPDYNRMAIVFNTTWDNMINRVRVATKNAAFNVHVIATAYWAVTSEELGVENTPSPRTRDASRELPPYNEMVYRAPKNREPAIIFKQLPQDEYIEGNRRAIAGYKVYEMTGCDGGRHLHNLGKEIMELQRALREERLMINGIDDQHIQSYLVQKAMQQRTQLEAEIMGETTDESKSDDHNIL